MRLGAPAFFRSRAVTMSFGFIHSSRAILTFFQKQSFWCVLSCAAELLLFFMTQIADSTGDARRVAATGRAAPTAQRRCRAEIWNV
jgi:hypothetical protein